ncbi:DNA polymerase beta superfamily protein [Nocardia violaceofusca]|uniref:DNA polymerase beta superfamily protein n=1 Tax=Nocardia violaceofusca TaxID=941182 RepID=UPI0007A5592B|nr:nucleotidyltransferase domain-containing protein [Nocardia violaceofusca]
MRNLLWEVVVGSRAHGSATAGSDTDYAGIYAEPTNALLGLHPPARAGRTGRDGDDAVHVGLDAHDLAPVPVDWVREVIAGAG